MKLLTANTTDYKSLRVWLFGLAGLCGALAPVASAQASAADTHVQANLTGQGLQSVTYRHDRSRNSYRHGHQRNRYDRRQRTRSHYRGNYSGRDYYSRDRSYRRSYNSGYSTGYNSGYRGASCQRVSKRGYWHGRRALIGGRECVNRRGYSYIAPNSRYLIRYN